MLFGPAVVRLSEYLTCLCQLVCSQSLVVTGLTQAGSVRLAGGCGRVGEPSDAATQLHQPSAGRPVPAGAGAAQPVRQPAGAAERPPPPGDAACARRRQEQVGSTSRSRLYRCPDRQTAALRSDRTQWEGDQGRRVGHDKW